VRIVPAGPSEIPALARLAERSYASAFRGILEPETLKSCTAAFFTARFERDWERTVVAWSEGAPSGFCLVTERHIDMLFVDPDRIGQGVGTALLRHAEAGGAVTLECFRDNRAARRFYEANGWRVAAEYERPSLGRMRAFVRYARPGEAAHPQ
jgi:putative acetyltransferase